MQTHEISGTGKAKGISTLIMSALILGACMSPLTRTHSYQDGWRRVEYIGPSTGSTGGHGNAQVAIDCSRSAELTLKEGKRSYVLVKENQLAPIVENGRKRHPKSIHDTRYWIVAVDDAQQFKPGDTLLANSVDCRLSAVPFD